MKVFLLLAFVACASAQWAPNCGRSQYPDPAPEQKTDEFGRVVGGWESRPNEFPYQLSLRRFGSHTCGAVIINSQWALSAAHCTSSGSASGLAVVAGAHRRSSPAAAEQTSNLLSIGNPIDLQRSSHWCLCPRDVTYDDDTVTISGWGSTFSGGFVTDELRYTNVQVWSNDECSGPYPGSIDDSMICAAAPGRDTCQGDSGGPMAYNNNGQFEVVGLTSWGRGCALATHPGVYARVSANLQWIADNTQ
ncbi:DgyrCDS14138 [Dimorphilus gyrociliatus]|uniref:DgyrCDS14138 n=1 Tax=Dimorphilus gyrociliatus TaxID=2664684 RepID=A0A7I8WCP9_9ANNE|nr:DgyrCDS14138 [Dimorphilus gyrociliatus]